MSRERPGFIYVARVLMCSRYEAIDGAWRPIGSFWGWKIGHAIDIPRRVVGLVGECRDVELLAFGVGSRDSETLAHRELRPSVAPVGPLGMSVPGKCREWYVDTSHVREWVARFNAAWRGSIRIQAREVNNDRDAQRTAYVAVRRAWATAVHVAEDVL